MCYIITTGNTGNPEYTNNQIQRKVKKVEIMLIIEALQAAKKSGCKVYMQPNYETWGYIVTPRNNVLVVNRAQWGSGVTFSLGYVPSQKNGSGCACMDGDDHDFGINHIDAETIAHYENEGLKFARRLKATLFNSPQEFFDRQKLFWKNEFIEL